MEFKKIYNLYIAKAQKKGRTEDEVNQIIYWLTGYKENQLQLILKETISFENFLIDAPILNPNRKLIKGSICGIKIEEIEDPVTKEIRYLDKLIDELAKGKKLNKILR